MPDKLPITVSELRAMIGLRVLYRGIPAEIIEVIEDGPSLVLKSHGGASIQADIYGNPTRRSPQTVTVRVLTANGTALHKDFLDLDLL